MNAKQCSGKLKKVPKHTGYVMQACIPAAGERVEQCYTFAQIVTSFKVQAEQLVAKCFKLLKHHNGGHDVRFKYAILAVVFPGFIIAVWKTALAKRWSDSKGWSTDKCITHFSYRNP